MNDREQVIMGLACAIGALKALINAFPNTEEYVGNAIISCGCAIELLKEQDKEYAYLLQQFDALMDERDKLLKEQEEY